MNRCIRPAALGFLFVFAAFLTLMEGAGNIFASDDETAPLSLAEIHGIEVMVLPIDPEAERNGLNKDQMQKSVELKLSKAGIKMLTGRELEKPGFPYLNIDVKVTKEKAHDLYGYNIKAELYKQIIQNPQDEIESAFQSVSVNAWSSDRTGTAPAGNLKDNVQKQVDDVMDKFIADYLAANPKK